MIIINYKTYPGAIGKAGLDIYRKAVSAYRKFRVPFFVAPPVFDMRLYKNKRAISQSVDPIHEGRGTGKIPVDFLGQIGFKGSLVNHSENRIGFEEIKEIVDALHDSGLVSVACASSLHGVSKISRLDPDYVAFEPPELIGTETSVSDAEPDVIKKAVKKSRAPLLVGAGVKSTHDVKAALELGATGVLVASHVVKAKNALKEISSLMKAFL